MALVPVPNMMPTPKASVSSGSTMLMAESPSLPTKRDTNTPSTAVYSDDTTSMATAGTEKASSRQKLNSCEIARFIKVLLAL